MDSSMMEPGYQPVSIQALRQLIEQLRETAPESLEVNAQTRFVGDLGLASLELIGLVFLCEQTFSVNLVEQNGLLAKIQTVGQAVDAIRSLQGESQCAS
jgi:acyl carrier protein